MHSTTLRDRHPTAFSLVELSIVLVILGLLTGAILTGQSLIRAAELRSVVADVSRYKAAALSFRDQYMALPGDFSDATRFWLSAGGDGANAACLQAQTQHNKATCNGNDDGKIQNLPGYTYYERFLAWKHLANAGLIEGSYLGRTAGAAQTYVQSVSENVPSSKLRNGFYDIFNETGAYNINYSASDWDRNFISVYGNTSTTGILLPEEAWNIDSKMDDGSPVYGNIISTQKSSPYGTDCTTSDNASAQYDVRIASPNCLLRFALF